VSPTGMTSVMTTPTAASLPVLVTFTVYSSTSPERRSRR
jgi:hypothetical protein